MDRNYIVELIKENRLQEAIKALEQASKGSHLHKDVIMLSSSYSEYAQMNRAATQDFQTLEMKRAKITDSLLSVLDDLSPEDFESVKVVPKYAQHTTSVPATGFDKKWLLYGAGLLLVLVIAYLAFGGKNDSAVPSQTVDNAHKITIIEVSAGDGNVATFKYDGEMWIEETKDRQFKFKEVKTEDGIIFLHDDDRNISLELNLNANEVLLIDDKNNATPLYKITGME